MSTDFFVADVFDRLLSDHDFFVEQVYRRYVFHIQYHGFMAEISRSRLLEAFTFLKEDCARSKQFELVDSSDIEEYKICGHLAYWLRRFNPINAIHNYETASTDEEVKLHHFFKRYAAQYVPFAIGFELCAYAEANGELSEYYKSDFKLSHDYFHVVSHFLKAKDVSPHAMFLIYKSLFFNLMTGRRYSG